MKFLSPKIHGFLDYAVILLLILAPGLFNFSEEATRLTYFLAGIYLLMVLLTAYPLGVVKLIPFTVHGLVEVILAPLLIAIPWLAGFQYDNPARNFFIVAGVALFFVWLVTDYKAADIAYGKRGLGRPHGAPA